MLRDFSLDLKGKDSRAYLEDVLKSVGGEGQDIERKNMIREKLRDYFKARECLCMVRPVADESKLARIEDQNWEELRPAFMYSLIIFLKNIFVLNYSGIFLIQSLNSNNIKSDLSKKG